ncbi:pre-mRNA splicing factor [Microsporum canis CBS 113480]|uniref:Pre-mRNA splicing factor n=1 Tax=Arthroderma otae (strain ATCC MYA-4605 / CBS 113480) TaxID=554155 RepID=C5FDP3_ARTOC|nr:pre-mRNA splicing factor [Microsporum canis CBS 113480]EEQ27839.1 pre-mRNA splicing factor [Microsporum canis CBS 113480]
MSEVSSTRLYLGNLPRNGMLLVLLHPISVTVIVSLSFNKQDIEEHFGSHGTGKITEIKLMQGFGFIEYEDAMDAKDVVPGEDTSVVAFTFLDFFFLCFSLFSVYSMDDALLIMGPVLILPSNGTDFKGERLTVQFARGPRRREPFPGPPERSTAPRPRRTIYRMQITGLPETSWQDLKDFARQSGLDVVYSETRDRDGKGFVEFENGNDLRTAVEKLDGTDFKGSRVTCTADIQPPMEDRVPKDPYRSRSPRRGPPYPPAEDYDRRGPPRGYSPRGHYRERSPHGGRDYYDRDGYGRRSPPRARVDDYPPPRRPYDDPYEMRSGGPPRHYDDPYMPRGAPFGGRPRSPPRGDYGGYERRGGYW